MSDPTPAGPGWYADPRETHLWRYWTGEKWSNLVANDIALLPPVNLDTVLSRPPRSYAARLVIAAAILVPALVAALAIRRGGHWVTGHTWAGYLAFCAVAGPALGWLGTKVSYRWRDAIFPLVIPPLALWYAAHLAWRLAYLPYRDWTPRPEEAATWLQVRHPQAPGALLYVRAWTTAMPEPR